MSATDCPSCGARATSCETRRWLGGYRCCSDCSHNPSERVVVVPVVHLSYTLFVSEANWWHRGGYIIAKHGVNSRWADEALDDPDALVYVPDPASKSGRGIRTVGYSVSAVAVLTVITLEDKGVLYGVNAWRSNETEQRRYREER
jgi:uncharacterized DUF497 family protein